MTCRAPIAVVAAMLATTLTAVAPPNGADAAHPGTNGPIAYVATDGNGQFDIFSVDPDGSNVTQLTHLDAGVGHLDWTADGGRIVFDIGATSPSGCISSDLWVVNADGTGLAQITDTPDVAEFDASWSPDGSQLVFTQLVQFDGCTGTGSDKDVWVIDADGTNPINIIGEGPGEFWSDHDPAWSPLGTRIAFVSDRPVDGDQLHEIYTAAPDGTDVVRLTSRPLDDLEDNGHPSWSPDGLQIAFELSSAVTGNTKIWVMDADGSNEREVTSGVYDVNPSWSPDGTKLAFVGTELGSGNEINTIDVDGNDRRTVIGVSAIANWPAWRPLVTPLPPPGGDVVIDNCDDPALASLATVSGDLLAVGVEDSAGIVLPELTAVGGDVEVTGNTSVTVIGLDSLNTVTGNVDITGNSSTTLIGLDSLDTVTGNVDITDNGSATVTIADGAKVDGDFMVESAGSEPLRLDDVVVSGDMTVAASHPGVVATTAEGATDVSVLVAGSGATMHVRLPGGTYETAVGFSILPIGEDGLAAQPGLAADGLGATIDPIMGYSFQFEVPQLNALATLSFEIDLTGLDAPTREALLVALAADRATLATRGDSAGSSYQAFALCSASESPTADGCVLLEAFDASGRPTTGQPALVRFSSVVGHFSSWAVTIVEPDPFVPAAPVVSAVAGWGAATVSWQAPSSDGLPITGYLVSAIAGGRTVATANVGPTITAHTFGGLANAVAHTFVVTARSNIGTGPEGSAAATPVAPRRYQAIDALVVCPSFVAHNPNPYPVHVWWVTTRGQVGETPLPAGATMTLTSARRSSAILVGAGIVQLQDAAIGTC